MRDFQVLRETMESIANNHILEPKQLGELLGGDFENTNDETMYYHDVYHGNMWANSLYSNCELRLPKTDEATNALITCDLSKKADILIDEVYSHYGDQLSIQPPPPQSSGEIPTYISVGDEKTELSYGFTDGGNKISEIIIKIQF